LKTGSRKKNIIMRNKEDDFLEFIRYSINPEAEAPGCVKRINWMELLDFAVNQSVSGLCYQGLMKLNDMIEEGTDVHDIFGDNKPTDDDIMHWMKKTVNLPKRNNSVDATLVKFCKFLKRRKVNFIVFKGQTISRCYPDPGIRVSGDIDFYVCSKERETTRELLKQIITFKDNPSCLHWEFDADGIPYEMHFHTAVFSVKAHQEFWDRLVEDDMADNMIIEDGKLRYRNFVTINDEDVPTLSPTVNAAYLFIHIYYHFMKEGIGFRQLCDWMVFLRKYENEIDRRRLAYILETLGFVKAYKAFGALVVDRLGLPEEVFPLTIDNEDRKWTGKILDVIYNGGNFGQFGRNVETTGLLHSLETGLRSFKHVFRFYSLSPEENGKILPELIKLSLKKNT